MNKFFFVFLLITSTVHAIPANSQAVKSSNNDFAWKLAAIDEGHPLEENSIEVTRAISALDKAMTVCDAKSQEQLGEQAYKTTQLMRKEQLYSRPIEILEGLKAILDGVNQKHDCSSYMATYFSVRKNSNYTHSEAIAALRVLMNATGTITYPKSK